MLIDIGRCPTLLQTTSKRVFEAKECKQQLTVAISQKGQKLQFHYIVKVATRHMNDKGVERRDSLQIMSLYMCHNVSTWVTWRQRNLC